VIPAPARLSTSFADFGESTPHEKIQWPLLCNFSLKISIAAISSVDPVRDAESITESRKRI
jgi:hypothetical protein